MILNVYTTHYPETGFIDLQIEWIGTNGNLCTEKRSFRDPSFAANYTYSMKLEALKQRFYRFMARIDFMLKGDQLYRATEARLTRYADLKKLAGWYHQVNDLSTLCAVLLPLAHDLEYMVPKYNHPEASRLAIDVSDMINFCHKEIKLLKDGQPTAKLFA